MAGLRFYRFAGILLLTMVLLAEMASAQKPYFSKVRFTLPTETPVFQTIIQDHNHYLWLGSDLGLFRFDGKSFREFPLTDSSEYEVTAIYESHDSTIWAGCKNGKIFFLDNGKMNPFDPEEGTSGKGISDLLIDENGTLWWSTFGEGVYYFTSGRVYNINQDDGLSDNYVYQLMEYQRGTVLAATDNGIDRLTGDPGEKEVIPLAVNKELPDIIVRTMVRDEEGRLWLGFHDAGAAYLDKGLGTVTQPESFRNWSHGTVDHIVFTGSSMWIGTGAEGILQIDPERQEVLSRWLSDDKGNTFGRINRFFKDMEGSIWLLTSTGLYRSTGGELQFLREINGKPLKDIHAVLKDSKGNIWYSNDEGLFKYGGSAGNSRQYMENISHINTKFMCLEEDRHGFIWAGTFDLGLFRIDPVSGNYRQITQLNGLVNNNVLSISTHQDTLWTATLGGASSIVLKGNSINSPLDIFSFDQENGLVNTFIYDVYEDFQDRIWFATDGDGICMYSGESFDCFGESSGIGDDVIYSISGDKKGNIWFSTATNGVYKYNGNTFMQFGLDEGLRSLEISSLEIYGDDIIMAHNQGIDVLHQPSFEISHYGRESGITDMEPELNAIYKARDGSILIGSRNGIIQFRPGLSGNPFSPNTVIEGMSVFLKPVQMVPGMKLPSGQNYISFIYNGLWLQDPENVVYRVMLEGYDLGWKQTYDQTAIYSSLPYGTYTFKVESSADHSFVNSSTTSFSFTIKRPYWLSPLFFFFIALFLVGLVFLYIRFRERRLKLIEAQKKEKIEFEFQLLKNQVNPHFLFNSFSTLISLIEDNQGQALEYTEKLSDFFRRMLQIKDTETISLAEELNLIEDYLFILRKRYGELIRLEMNIPGEYLGSAIPPMTLQMLIENAVKHNVISKEKQLLIRLYVEGDRLVLENDYQPKRRVEDSTGIGLENISKRYRLLVNKEIIIEQDLGTFRVKLPVIPMD